MSNKKYIIYADMCADLFHAGHVNFLRQCKNYKKNVYLIIGIINDKDIESYKRKPICTLKERVEVVKACKYVDKVIGNSPLKITKDFVKKHEIDYVIHAGEIPEDEKNNWYSEILEIYREVPRTKGISTTDIINRIKNRIKK
jgi:cytidyltransferase-like protein